MIADKISTQQTKDMVEWSSEGRHKREQGKSGCTYKRKAYGKTEMENNLS
jgi:hypothetical protein